MASTNIEYKIVRKASECHYSENLNHNLMASTIFRHLYEWHITFQQGVDLSSAKPFERYDETIL